MERKIGEIFNYQDNWYQCIENTGYGCIICHFNTHNNICCNNVLNIIGNCLPPYRKDYKSVVFRKLEKVGEPFKSMGNCYQVYKTYCEPTNVGLGSSYDGSKVVIKIKQNKENMEEKKLNLKEFDLEAAKAGKPVYTRDGRKVRIICFDAKCIKPIVALIQGSDNSEQIEYYTENGVFSNGGTGKNRDLMILLEKKEGWINIYNRNTISTSKENCYIMTGVSVFKTKESAISYKDKDKEYIDTIKIEWEE